MADADTTDFDVDAEAPGGGVREGTRRRMLTRPTIKKRDWSPRARLQATTWKSYWTCWTSMATSTSMSKAIVRW